MFPRRRPHRPANLRRAAAIPAAALLALAVAAPGAGARLVYVKSLSTNHPSIWIARDDGRGAHRLIAGSGPRISPDGRRVAFVRTGRDHHAEVRVISASGGHSRLLLRDALQPVWSPDSRRIAVLLDTAPGTPEARSDVATIDVRSGAVHTIAPAGLPTGVSFSPRGDELASTSTTPAAAPLGVSTYVWRAPADGSGPPVRVTPGHRNSAPVWGPRWIAIVRERSPRANPAAVKQQLYLVKPSGAGLHRLTRTHLAMSMFGYTPLDWSANGHRLIAELNGIGTDYVVTVNPRTGLVRRVGKRAGGVRGYGVAGAGISRDGRLILGTADLTTATPAVVAIPFHGGRPRVLARDAYLPDWNR